MRSPWLLCSVLPLVAACAAAPLNPPRFETAPCPEAAADADGSAVITRFYGAFARRDFRSMACAYDPNVEFTDPVFGTLRGKRALAMWAMLTSRGSDLEVRFSRVRAQGTTGSARWDAFYTFPFLVFTNDVDNHIEASFELRDGKIVRHTDSFDLQRWMKLALWPLGGAVSEDTFREQAKKQLDEFIAKYPQFQPGSAP